MAGLSIRNLIGGIALLASDAFGWGGNVLEGQLDLEDILQFSVKEKSHEKAQRRIRTSIATGFLRFKAQGLVIRAGE